MPHEALELDPNEQVLLSVKRTPIGLVPIFLTGILAFIGLLLAVFLIGRFRDTIAIPPWAVVGIISGVGLLIIIGVYIAAVVYLNNKLIITNESIVQVLQRTLFNRQTSQLSLANVEDVTVEQPGFLSHLFNYGTITVETAGEQSNFIFPLANDPYPAAKAIIEAHENFTRTHFGDPNS